MLYLSDTTLHLENYVVETVLTGFVIHFIDGISLVCQAHNNWYGRPERIGLR